MPPNDSDDLEKKLDKMGQLLRESKLPSLSDETKAAIELEISKQWDREQLGEEDLQSDVETRNSKPNEKSQTETEAQEKNKEKKKIRHLH